MSCHKAAGTAVIAIAMLTAFSGPAPASAAESCSVAPLNLGRFFEGNLPNSFAAGTAIGQLRGARPVRIRTGCSGAAANYQLRMRGAAANGGILLVSGAATVTLTPFAVALDGQPLAEPTNLLIDGLAVPPNADVDVVFVQEGGAVPPRSGQYVATAFALFDF